MNLDSAVNVDVGGHCGFVMLPPEQTRVESMPWVWFAPMFVGSQPSKWNTWTFERLLAQGIAVCGVDVGESYGNPEGRASYTEFHQFVVSQFGLSAGVCLWPQSRGGLMHYNWAAEHPELVRCIGGTYTVCNLASYPGIEKACAAYGMSASELQSHLAEHNPIDRLAPIAQCKVPIFLVHGDKDTKVPLEDNSAELARRYKALGGPVELLIIEGKGHGVDSEFFESDAMVDFFVKHAKG